MVGSVPGGSPQDLAAFQLVGTYRGAAEICGVTYRRMCAG